VGNIGMKTRERMTDLGGKSGLQGKKLGE